MRHDSHHGCDSGADIDGAARWASESTLPARFDVGAAIDLQFAKVVGLSFVAHAVVVLAMLLLPLEPEGLPEDPFVNPGRFVRLILVPPATASVEPPDVDGARAQGTHNENAGKLDPKGEDRAANVRDARRADPLERERHRAMALGAGLLAELDGGVSDVLGFGGLGSGVDEALGHLRGTTESGGRGPGGLGTRGSRLKGGGESLGIAGLGGGRTAGLGGLHEVDLVGGRGSASTRVLSGDTSARGCQLQQVVGDVLDGVHDQVRACYEKELARDPSLAGKVTTQFTIGPTGVVTKTRITASTLDDETVERCLLRVIERLRFPPCAGGRAAEVTYPWIFRLAGR